MTMTAEATDKSQEPFPGSANLAAETAESRTGHYLPKSFQPGRKAMRSSAPLCIAPPLPRVSPRPRAPLGQQTRHDLAFKQPQARPRGYPPRLLEGRPSPKETAPPDLEQGWGSRERLMC